MRLLLAIPLLAMQAAAATYVYKAATYVYKEVGGHALQADVFRHEDKVARPAILWLHGGALILGNRGGLRKDQLQRYIEAGFVVVSIDYRLAPETKLGEIFRDVEDAYAWIRSKGPALFQADPKRIAVVGHSAGGFLTLLAGYRLRPRPRALVSFYGYGDFTADWESKPSPTYTQQPLLTKEEAQAALGDLSKRGRFYLYTRQQGVWPQEVAGADSKNYKSYCPVRNVSRTYPPTFFLHGDADTDVPFSQSEEMARELKLHGVKYEFFRMPQGRHGFDAAMDDPLVSAALDRVIKFIQKYVR
jgi:acetyl esterase/lipase